ncbi:MAG: gamma carbonic anhydrase family protein [Pseudomonadota bacterium]
MTLYSYQNNQPQLHHTVFIAPTAQIIGNVHIGQESSVWFGSILRGDMDTIRVGEQTNIQDLCMCHADEAIPLTIGNRVTIGHGCIVHGCTIEDECLIGMGAVIMNNAVIGKGCVIAAGSVVLENTIIPPYSLVVGAPGKIKKTFENKNQIQTLIKIMSDIYVANGQNYGSDQIFYEITD